MIKSSSLFAAPSKLHRAQAGIDIIMLIHEPWQRR